MLSNQRDLYIQTFQNIFTDFESLSMVLSKPLVLGMKDLLSSLFIMDMFMVVLTRLCL